MNGGWKRLAVGGLAIAAAGCHSVPGSNDVPALVVAPTAESRAALSGALETALGRPVTIADDALTDSSLLVVGRQQPPGEQGRVATGRNMDVPVQFRLVQSGGRCVLVDSRDGSRYPLDTVQCRPE